MAQGRSSPSARGVADVYARNSTVFQIGNWRASYQLEHLPKLAEELGYEPVIWEEQGKSGESLTRRPKMRQILMRIKAGTSVAIVCASLDRLSRDMRMIDGSQIWEACREAGAVIITPDKVWRPGEDADDDASFFQFWGASRENRQRAKSMYEGMVTRAVREPFYRGQVPVGYMREWEPRMDSRGVEKMRSKWVIDPEMVKVIRHIFDRFPKQSINSLVGELNQRGEEWWYKSHNPDGNVRRRPWHTTEITRIVHRPIYAGRLVWGSSVTSRRTKPIFARLQGDKPISHEVPELAIVSQDEWLACQIQKRGSPARARAGLDITPKAAGARRILSGIVYCPGGRDHVMVAGEAQINSTSKHYSIPGYACGTYRTLGSVACTPHQVQERRLLDGLRPVVVDALQRLLLSGDLDDVLESKSAKRIPSIVEARRAKIVTAKNALYDDFYLEKRIDRAEFETQTKRWDEELSRLDEEAVLVEAPHANLVQLSQFLRTNRELIEEANDEKVRGEFLPVDPEVPPYDNEGNYVWMNERQRETWYHVVHLLFERLTFFYKNNGPRRKADAKLRPEDCTFKEDIKKLLYPPSKGKARRKVDADLSQDSHHYKSPERGQYLALLAA